MFWDFRHGIFLDICKCCVYSLYFMVNLSVSRFSNNIGLKTSKIQCFSGTVDVYMTIRFILSSCKYRVYIPLFTFQCKCTILGSIIVFQSVLFPRGLCHESSPPADQRDFTANSYSKTECLPNTTCALLIFIICYCSIALALC